MQILKSTGHVQKLFKLDVTGGLKIIDFFRSLRGGPGSKSLQPLNAGPALPADALYVGICCRIPSSRWIYIQAGFHDLLHRSEFRL
jgi:hypothetical protein